MFDTLRDILPVMLCVGVSLLDLERLAPNVTEGVTVWVVVPETVCDAETLLD